MSQYQNRRILATSMAADPEATQPFLSAAMRVLARMRRYAVVGLAANASCYLIYLTITWAAVEAKLAMTVTYLVGASIGYLGNRTWAFRYRGQVWPSLLRYSAAHGLGYLTNLVLLLVFADRLGYPHQAVQAVAIFVVALLLFAIFNAFVFRPATTGNSA